MRAAGIKMLKRIGNKTINAPLNQKGNQCTYALLIVCVFITLTNSCHTVEHIVIIKKINSAFLNMFKLLSLPGN